MVAVDQKAPDFIAPTLLEGNGEIIDLVSRIEAFDAVVLLFAPADFVAACTAEWQAVVDAGWHDHPAVGVLGVTADSLFILVAIRKLKISTPHGVDILTNL